jgi:multidrug efflux pump subunit AcrB
VTLPTPAGGKYRQIMVDVDQTKLLAKGLTPLQVANALNLQDLTLPGGDVKIGKADYTVRTNSMPPTIDGLNNIPVAYQNGATVFLRDIGHVRDGNLVQQNVVRADGKRSVLISIIKNDNASTLAVVNAVKRMLKIARTAAPPGTVIKSLFDQSVFVTSSLISVLRRRDRGGAHGADDPALSRIVAPDDRRRGFDPACDADLARRALSPWRDDQHNDVGRLGASSRHPG